MTMNPTQRSSARSRPGRTRGFTLVELMITLTVLAVVMIVLSTVMYTAARSKVATANRIESSQAGRVALDLIARDLRSAGYGADTDYPGNPQPPIAYIDSTQVLICENLSPYPDTTGGTHSAPLAYNPAGSPKPKPLVSSAWAPPARYNTGAEIVRWTLDVNDDGQIDAGDVAAPAGADAQRTPNPNDFVLVREVYGDNTGGMALNNGGSQERIALVRKPAASSIPPMFTVYMKGSATPWDWSNGPVPAAQLANVERVVVKVVATSGKADSRGQYAETLYQTDVNSLRNTPQLTTEYVVDGYVYEDKNTNHVKDAGDVGIAGASVTLGGLSAVTSSTGYFMFSVGAGHYVLKDVAPAGYNTFTSPDSFVLDVPPAATRSFADTVVKGGTVNAQVFEDLNGNSVWDAGEPARPAEKLTLSPPGTVFYTNALGAASAFATVGPYTVSLAVPDSFACETSNPAAGTMTNGGTLTHVFALQRSQTATVAGRVWYDKNSNGAQNAGEAGLQNVWVGVVSSTTQDVLAFAYTNATGDYSLTVPANSPPGTDPYIVECIPTNGYYPVGSSSYNNVLLTGGQNLTGRNFGLNAFQLITLTASRVLSLGTGDVMESDWNGNQTQNAHGDQDILLGADANGTDQVSVWFNQYDANPLFNTTRDYARTAPNAVLSMSVDTLTIDAAPFRTRVDLVTGTKLAGAGNFFTWFNQNTKSNEGYLPATYSQAYRTSDLGDVQAVVTGNVTGGSAIDILVGTKSPTAGQGTVELWKSNDAATPTYTFVEAYPTVGTLGYPMGEVNAMVLTRFRTTGQDLVVGTKTGTYSGQVMVFSRVDSASVFKLRWIKTYGSQYVKALAVSDITGDGKIDLVVATQGSTASGRLELWRNQTSGSLIDFNRISKIDVPFVPYSLVAADFGGAAASDVAVGYRSDESSYGGGVKIYYCDSGVFPASGTDPSGGSVVNFVPALTSGNYNYGVKPALPAPPYLVDLAAGVKSSNTTGALVVFIR